MPDREPRETASPTEAGQDQPREAGSALAGAAAVAVLLGGLLAAALRPRRPQPWWKPVPPPVTEFQGEQCPAVDPPHELTDVNAWLVAKWLIAFVVAGILVHVGIWAAFTAWNCGQQRALFPPGGPGTRALAPEPRLLPEPVEAAVGGPRTLRTWEEELRTHREREEHELARLGLFDPATRLPVSPPGSAGGTGGTPSAGTARMPSDASGGTHFEERLP